MRKPVPGDFGYRCPRCGYSWDTEGDGRKPVMIEVGDDLECPCELCVTFDEWVANQPPGQSLFGGTDR
jgi:hypothetical protein